MFVLIIGWLSWLSHLTRLPAWSDGTLPLLQPILTAAKATFPSSPGREQFSVPYTSRVSSSLLCAFPLLYPAAPGHPPSSIRKHALAWSKAILKRTRTPGKPDLLIRDVSSVLSPRSVFHPFASTATLDLCSRYHHASRYHLANALTASTRYLIRLQYIRFLLHLHLFSRSTELSLIPYPYPHTNHTRKAAQDTLNKYTTYHHQYQPWTHNLKRPRVVVVKHNPNLPAQRHSTVQKSPSGSPRRRARRGKMQR